MPIDSGTLLALIQARRNQQVEQDTTAAPAVIGRGLGNVADLLGTFGRNTAAVDAREAEQANLTATAQGEHLKQILEITKAAKEAGLTVTPDSLRAAIQPPAAAAPVPYTGAERLFGAARPLVKPAGADARSLQFVAKPDKEKTTPGNTYLSKESAAALNLQAKQLGNTKLAVFTEGDWPNLQIEAALRKPTKDPGEKEELSKADALAFIKNRQFAGTKGIVKGANLSDLTAYLGRHIEDPAIAQAILEANATKEFGQQGFAGFGMAPRSNAEILAELAATAQKGKDPGTRGGKPGAGLRPGALSRSQFPPGVTDAQAIEQARQRGIALTILP